MQQENKHEQQMHQQAGSRMQPMTLQQQKQKDADDKAKLQMEELKIQRKLKNVEEKEREDRRRAGPPSTMMEVAKR